MTNKPHAYAMHAKTSEENIHATRYLQEKPVVVVDPDVLLDGVDTWSFGAIRERKSRKVQEDIRINNYNIIHAPTSRVHHHTIHIHT